MDPGVARMAFEEVDLKIPIFCLVLYFVVVGLVLVSLFLFLFFNSS